MPVKIDPRLLGIPGPIGARHARLEPEPKDQRDGLSSPKDKIIRVKMLQDRIAFPDHVHSQEYQKGKEYDVPEFLAGPWFEKNLAVKIPKTRKGDKK